MQLFLLKVFVWDFSLGKLKAEPPKCAGSENEKQIEIPFVRSTTRLKKALSECFKRRSVDME